MSGESRHDDSSDVVERSGRRCGKFAVADFKLTCNKISDVSCCQDGMPFFIYCFYRFLVGGYFFGFLIFFIVFSIQGVFGVKFLIYLTNWTYMLVTVYLCTASINVLLNFVLDHRGLDGSHDGFHRIRNQLQWLLFNIAITSSIIVTLVYWPILRPMIPEDMKPPLYLDMSIHLFTSIFCLLDLFITKVTIKFHHVIYPALYLIVYGLFAIFYWVAGGTDPYGDLYIYPIIDFENAPGIAAATMIGIVVAVFLAHGFLKLLYYLRVRFVDRRVETSVEEERARLNPQGHSFYNGEVI
ncbi:protein rolling stone [Strongylocentrotus purpuratus]|uniref:Protein rolling stone n=1 Tax=Strongylocentrotus purpuratus TaxID=7668 RepID=A0A7M7HLZ9_STRPU|nr:protein rolling stone [Strongylocentrotus purpuratus]